MNLSGQPLSNPVGWRPAGALTVTEMRLSFKPRTLKQLIATGFFLLCALQVVSLALTLQQLSGLGSSSRRLVNESVMAMRAARIMTAQTTAMERNFRQYLIVNDAELLQAYEERRKNFSTAAIQLRRLSSGDLRLLIEDILALERRIRDQFDVPTEDVGMLFATMNTLDRRLHEALDIWIDGRLNDIREETTRTRNLLTLQGLSIAGTALVLALVFTALIIRPLRHIDQAIRQLGTGSALTHTAIQGPRDIRALGERIDWLRDRLETLDRQRSTFFRQVSHELKTPLAAIRESSALMYEGVVGTLNTEQREIMRIQQDNCERLLHLINELLRYQTASFGVLEDMPQTLRLDLIVLEVLEAQTLALRARALNVQHSLEPHMTRGHAEQLRAIIDNLLSNAIRFSPPGGTLSLNLTSKDDLVLFDCIDEGPGIASEDQERIFEPFYQGMNADLAAFQGSGLGLAIANEYARAHKGEVMLLPAARGAHFRLQLPLAHMELS